MEVLKSRDEILQIIDNVSRTEGLGKCEILDVQVNDKGEGFVGQILFVTLSGKDSRKELSLVLKCAPQDEKIRASVPVRITFENETLFYTEVYPAFMDFEKRCGVKGAADLVPKCYKTSLQSGAEIVVLQNLKPLGFEVFPKSSLLDHDHVKLVFETYGRYHAYSYAYKDQHPEEFERLTSKLIDVYADIANKEDFIKMFVEYVRLIKTFFSPGKDDEILKKLNNYETKEGIAKIFRSCTSGGCEHPVIAHGDCWSSNMMFKYEGIGDGRKPKDMRIIDWQVIQLASPACDLSYFLYSGGSGDIFANLDDYLKIYHNTLCSCAKRLGTDPEKVIPFAALKEDWRRFAKFGVAMAMMAAKAKVTYKDQAVDLTEYAGRDKVNVGDIFLKSGCDEELYKKRMVDIIRHAAEIDAL